MGPLERLESWKEIAAYLKRDVRTVQRWEASEQLPVCRHQHKARGSVYALRSEIERWRERRAAAVRPIEDDSADSDNPTSRAVRPRPLIWPPGLVIDLVDGATPPARFRMLGSQVRELRPPGAGGDRRVVQITVNVFVKE